MRGKTDKKRSSGSQKVYKMPAKRKTNFLGNLKKHRTTESENKYRKYKNKLTNIIKACKISLPYPTLVFT